MNKLVVGIGEILWDMLPSGKALGGAPANFAYHASRLGAEGFAVSAIGDDALGHEILEMLNGKNLKNIISVVNYPTGTVEVTLNEKGVPSYIINEGVAWDHIPFTAEMKSLAERTDAVCYGSLVQRFESRKSVLSFIRSVKPDALKIFDANLRQHYYSRELLDESLKLADILKINDEEIRVFEELFDLGNDDAAACKLLIDKYDLRLVILTRGAEGSEVITKKEVIPQKAAEAKVIDTVGAGDAFTAAFVVAYLRGDSLSDAQSFASDTAAYVCSCNGAMPE